MTKCYVLNSTLIIEKYYLQKEKLRAVFSINSLSFFLEYDCLKLAQ